MDVFLTSSMGGNREVRGEKIPHRFDNRNHFVDRLRQSCGNSPRVLMIASDPTSYAINDMYHRLYEGAFELSGFNVPRFDYVDDRCPELLDDMDKCQLIILSGGHVPTENAYFQQIGLRERLAAWDGTVAGVSAGSMNAAETVYAQPELEGEAADPEFVRYMPGLGLADVNVLPHFSQVRHLRIDGLRVERDLTVTDSFERPILAINDGSYILVQNARTADEVTTVYGTAWLFDGGKRKKVCRRGMCRRL